MFQLSLHIRELELFVTVEKLLQSAQRYVIFTATFAKFSAKIADRTPTSQLNLLFVIFIYLNFHAHWPLQKKQVENEKRNFYYIGSAELTSKMLTLIHFLITPTQSGSD